MGHVVLEVDDTHVSMQVTALAEGSMAESAGVGLVAGVDALVLRERGKVGKSFGTDVTGEGLFPGVDSSVTDLPRSLGERLSTHRALVPSTLLVCMSPHVDL